MTIFFLFWDFFIFLSNIRCRSFPRIQPKDIWLSKYIKTFKSFILLQNTWYIFIMEKRLHIWNYISTYVFVNPFSLYIYIYRYRYIYYIIVIYKLVRNFSKILIINVSENCKDIFYFLFQYILPESFLCEIFPISFRRVSLCLRVT